MNPLDTIVPSTICDWTDSRQQESIFPKQYNNCDCGVLVPMYFYYLTRQAQFDFTAADTNKIKSWLCSLLVS